MNNWDILERMKTIEEILSEYYFLSKVNKAVKIFLKDFIDRPRFCYSFDKQILNKELIFNYYEFYHNNSKLCKRHKKDIINILSTSIKFNNKLIIDVRYNDFRITYDIQNEYFYITIKEGYHRRAYLLYKEENFYHTYFAVILLIAIYNNWVSCSKWERFIIKDTSYMNLLYIL